LVCGYYNPLPQFRKTVVGKSLRFVCVFIAAVGALVRME